MARTDANYTAQILATTCSHCQAGEGQYCWRPTGPDSNFQTTMVKPHKARQVAAVDNKAAARKARRAARKAAMTPEQAEARKAARRARRAARKAS